MAKTPTKNLETNTNPQNSPNLTSKLDNKLSKSRQQINQENYQKNKERRNNQAKERYTKKKEQKKEQLSKYYEAENISVLMSFGEYTELSPAKKQLWLDFNWTLQDCQKAIKEGLGGIVAIMKLEQVADNLIKDYWTTAKSEVKKGKNWNSLSEEQQSKIIKYWGREKARIENGYIDTAGQLEKQSQTYLKELELAKFHEERGKIKCPCYQCQESKKVQGEIKAEMFKEDETEKEQCSECGKWVKELDEENGICKRCMSKYEW